MRRFRLTRGLLLQRRFPPPSPFAGSTSRGCAGTVGQTSEIWPLPSVPNSVLSFVGEETVRKLVPMEARFIEDRAAAEDCVPELLSTRLIGVDCEGVALGRWGRLCVCQITTPERVYIFDALRDGVMGTLKPVLESKGVVKVMHDCREDSAAMLSQFDVRLDNVFDLQVAHMMLLEQQASRPFQISLNELLKTVVHLENDKEVIGQRMKEDPNIWFYRPLHEDLIAYASLDVRYLPLLHWLLCNELKDLSGGRVVQRSQQYADYSQMNLHLSSPKAVERRGLRLRAMLATRAELGVGQSTLYFKLNLGAHRQGAATKPESVAQFENLRFGDIIDCWVSAWTTNGHVIFVEKLDPLKSYPDPTTNPTAPRKRLRRVYGG